jgi:hypothetical protein
MRRGQISGFGAGWRGFGRLPRIVGVRVSRVSGVPVVSEFEKGWGWGGETVPASLRLNKSAPIQLPTKTVGITDYRIPINGRPEWTRTIDLLRVREAL